MALLKKQEVLCLELGNRDGLMRSYGRQASILQAWGRLEEAMALLKKQEVLCLELGNRDGLMRSYGNQALILKDWGPLEEAFALHKKEEALCLELGNKDGLMRSYGRQASILTAREAEMAHFNPCDESLAISSSLGLCRIQGRETSSSPSLDDLIRYDP